MDNLKKAYLAGGCFWGVEELFRKQIGVIDTEVGYMGGETDKPTYRNHVGHAEAIEITYDTTQTNYKNVLDYFFRIHNPTTIDKQGNDIGSSYRSSIFYQTEDEKKQAEYMIKIVDDSMRWTDLAVTKIEPFKKFWPAEDYHQDYLQKNKGGYTCHYERFGSFGV